MRALLLLVVAVFALLLAGGARAQSADAAAFAPCPYCDDDPALLAKLGLVRHGAMPFGARDSLAVAAGAPRGTWWFLESAHFRVALGIGACAIEPARIDAVERELALLRAVLPKVPRSPRKLDPPLRLHLAVQRLEHSYARIQRALGVADADFPESRPLDGPFMGDGRFLGEKDKFEFAIFASEADHNAWIKPFSGATVTDTLRWHFSPQHKLHASVPAHDSDIRTDLGLHTHLVHNLAHLMLCAYKHFSYDPPAWLDEGLAIYFEKEIDPNAITLEGQEGGSKSVRPPANFAARARALAQSDGGPRFARLLGLREVADFEGDDLVASWAIAKFLVEAHPQPFARFVGALKGQLDERGVPTGRDLGGLQRKLLQELWQWNPQQLDREWRAWFSAQKR
ncbi:MAG: hypothetical protein EPO68_08435 [Planctomycetota bacterium]|nr:MAG: hypothetical protein EPO68_08435 [Planctomycetota bacterium]